VTYLQYKITESLERSNLRFIDYKLSMITDEDSLRGLLERGKGFSKQSGHGAIGESI
jgi:hypothetical protein